jgi:3-isopropylmalate/(R)-2-methylmalate dehydratase small subunit
MDDAVDPAARTVTIDVGAQSLSSRSVQTHFEMLSRHRRMFLEGLDSIGLSLTYEVQIAAFARDHWARSPWLKDVASTARTRLGNT